MHHHQPQPLPAAGANHAAPQEPTALRVVGSHAQICARCGSLDETRTKTPGSLAIEVLLWLCFLVPGIIYTLWRHSRKHTICARCGSTDLVQAGTPIGRQLVAQYHPNTSVLGIYGGGIVQPEGESSIPPSAGCSTDWPHSSPSASPWRGSTHDPTRR